MALQKAITTQLGIVVNYHRISNLDIFTNLANNIQVDSYISADERQKELDWIAACEAAIAAGEEPPEGPNVYIEGSMYSTDYDQTMTIGSAYEYLKTLDTFDGAIDV